MTQRTRFLKSPAGLSASNVHKVSNDCIWRALKAAPSRTAACSARNEALARAAGADSFTDYANGLEDIASSSFDAMLAVNGSFPISTCSRILKPKGAYILVGADSLQPAALTVPLRGRRLKAATFFSLIGKDGLQQTVDEVARCGFVPSMVLVHSFEEAAGALQALEHTHPQGKIVAVFER